mmetsp:Transcript_8693/g.23259  ORF Transcript_8693/g.23259 Transcript_8693/m.23259 type:complete len:274 (-) Transcript_8693:618-1439(-)
MGRCPDRGALQPLIVQAVHVKDRQAALRAQCQLQLLVEVAVEELPVPTHVDVVRAHHERHRLDVEVPHEKVHVTLQSALLAEEVEEALYWHVGDGDERVELDAHDPAKLLPVLHVEQVLPRRQEGAGRVEDQVQAQCAGCLGSALAIAKCVQYSQPLDATVKDPSPSLLVRLGGVVRREGCNDVNLVLHQELGEVLLPGFQEHGQVATVNDAQVWPLPALAQGRGTLDQAAESRVHLRRAAGDVQDRHAGRCPQQVKATLNDLLGHHLLAQWG